MSRYYYLNDANEPVAAKDLVEWGKRYNEETKRVAVDHIGKCRVSTVFLGLDHRFDDVGDPVLWETMIFPDDSWEDLYCERYTSREEALEGHKKACEWARERY